jgi:hypothetical protein
MRRFRHGRFHAHRMMTKKMTARAAPNGPGSVIPPSPRPLRPRGGIASASARGRAIRRSPFSQVHPAATGEVWEGISLGRASQNLGEGWPAGAGALPKYGPGIALVRGENQHRSFPNTDGRNPSENIAPQIGSQRRGQTARDRMVPSAGLEWSEGHGKGCWPAPPTPCEYQRVSFADCTFTRRRRPADAIGSLAVFEAEGSWSFREWTNPNATYPERKAHGRLGRRTLPLAAGSPRTPRSPPRACGVEGSSAKISGRGEWGDRFCFLLMGRKVSDFIPLIW